MTHVVAEPCVLCKHTDCVEVCPVDAFREGENCLVIDPIGREINARLSRVWPTIRTKKEPLPDHAQWATVASKRASLSEAPGDGD